MLKWFRGAQLAKKVRKMVANLQDQQDCRILRSFFPRLAKATFIKQIFEHMKARRIQQYKQEFFNEV